MGDVTLFKGGLPSYIKRGVDDMTRSLAGGSLGMRRISIKGGAFREMVGGKEYRVSEERSLNVIIVKAAEHVSRTYYKGTYSDGDAVRPTCWSTDGQRPDADVKDKQSGTCQKCPMNIKGSAQGEGKACRYSKRLAVVIEGELEKEEVYQLTVPATSIFGDGEGTNKMPLQAYAQWLVKEGFPACSVVTELRFDIKSPVPKLFFRPIREVKEDEYEIVERLMESEEATRAVSMTVAQADGVQKEADEDEAPPPKAVPKKPAPKPAPVEDEEEDEEEDVKPAKKAKPVVEEDEEEEEVEEPKKTAPKKTAAAPAESKLEDLVDEWDDD